MIMSAFCMCPLIGACGAHVLLLLTAANMLMFLLTCMQTLLVSLDFLVVIRVSSADCLTASRRTLLVWQEVLKGNTSLLKGNTNLLEGDTSLLRGNTSWLKGNTSLLFKAAESQPLQVKFLEQQVGCHRCCACVIARVVACHCMCHCMCHCVDHCVGHCMCHCMCTYMDF